MYKTPHYAELKKYVGRKEYQDENIVHPKYDKPTTHRAHFRITADQKEFLEKTAKSFKKTVNSLCKMLIKKMLPLIETQVFRTIDEMEEHHYNVGGYGEDLFVVMADETFLMLQYLKETLHFYSYCEVFRFVADYFKDGCDDVDAGDIEGLKAKIVQCEEEIEQECKNIYSRKRKTCTIVPSILRRIRATKVCLFDAGQIYLKKMLV